ncbi:MAG: RNA methyltransferase [Bacteroidetes bacterium]|nr:MAG: RNA methyltransferase [Bacteroidota bacterium]
MVEGVKMIQEALRDRNELIQEIYTTDPTVFENDRKERIHVISAKELEQISALKTPQKALAILAYKKDNEVDTNGIILALDGIQDPGNFGTIVRTAEWFGIQTIICSEDAVDQYNPKCVQASMGSMLRLTISYKALAPFIESYDNPVYGTLLSGNDCYQEDFTENGMIVMGNEGNGISDAILPLINKPLLIPGSGKTESLNVSIATGIILSEFKRRRLL